MADQKDARMAENFRARLDRLEEATDVQGCLDKCLGDGPLDDIKAKALQAMAAAHVRQIWWRFIELSKCDSPIEEVMHLALLAYGGASATDDDVIFARCDGGQHWETAGWALTQISICSQHRIGDYSVDFLVTGYSVIHGPKEVYVAKVGMVAVEVDSHDFHEKTKEQAAHDRKRDRILQSTGVKVFRYTGSEVWRDPIKCAREVVTEAISRKRQVE